MRSQGFPLELLDFNSGLSIRRGMPTKFHDGRVKLVMVVKASDKLKCKA